MTEEPKKNRKNLLKRKVGYWGLFACFTVVAFCIIFIAGITSNIPHSFGGMVVFGFLYALAWGLALTFFIAFLRWVFCWRNFKRFLFGVACLLTLVALFYAEEDIRGKHNWADYKSALAAQGEKMDFDDYIPPPVPDDQNFAMSPVWIANEKYTFLERPERAEAWYGQQIYGEDVAKFMPLMPCGVLGICGTNWANHWNFPTTPNMNKNWALARLMDLKPWQQYYRSVETTNAMAQIPIAAQPQSPAADVLLALSKFDPLIEQLRQDSQRPDSRFPVSYNDEDPSEILVPHLAAVKRTAQVLQLRAVAELQNNQTDRAFDDFKLMMRLVDSVKTEPFAITHLVRAAVMQIALQVVYEGLARHQWSDAQLAEMDSELAPINFPADGVNSIRAEAVMHAKVIAWLEQKRSRIEAIMGMWPNAATPAQTRAAEIGLYLMPKGWFYSGDIIMSRATQLWITGGAVDEAKQIVSPALTVQTGKKVDAMLQQRTALDFLTHMLVPEWKDFVRRCAYSQECVDLARTAIALERYRLAHGALPVSLAALAPQWMPQVPHDIINGDSLHYHRTSDGQFVLYSVGWNETDDGGVVVAAHDPDSGVNTEQGDWVWKYPAE